eukprot:8332858-Alexandrium_andersonii.AAC.1
MDAPTQGSNEPTQRGLSQGIRAAARGITHKVSGRTKIRGACSHYIRASYRHLSKWTGEFCKSDPSRSNELAQSE